MRSLEPDRRHQTGRRGRRLADKWRDVFDRNRRERELAGVLLEIRAERRSAPDLEEDTGVIHREALARQAKRGSDSEPPSSKGGVVVLVIGTVRSAVNKRSPFQTLVVILAAIAAYVVLKLRGAVP